MRRPTFVILLATLMLCGSLGLGGQAPAPEPTNQDRFAAGLEALQRADTAQVGPLAPAVPAHTPALEAALIDLATALGATPSQAAAEVAASGVDRLAPAQREALAATVHAFHGYHLTTQDAFGAIPVDRASVVAAQRDLLATVPGLIDAFDGPEAPRNGMVPISILGLVYLEVSGDDTYYGTTHLLVIDVGGNDEHVNNAGGSGWESDHCHVHDGPAVDLETPAVHPGERQPATAAALIDLAGDDVYGATLDCGTNGGGAWGAGLLVDLAGADQYKGGSLGTNGGAYANGIGLLFDAAGDDVYTAGSVGTNGGASANGYGRLIDVQGDDRYDARLDGVNGGAIRGQHCVNTCANGVASAGLLLDLSGVDQYYDIDLRSAQDAFVVPKEQTGALMDLQFVP